jgi:hypothetical protein
LFELQFTIWHGQLSCMHAQQRWATSVQQSLLVIL